MPALTPTGARALSPADRRRKKRLERQAALIAARQRLGKMDALRTAPITAATAKKVGARRRELSNLDMGRTAPITSAKSRKIGLAQAKKRREADREEVRLKALRDLNTMRERIERQLREPTSEETTTMMGLATLATHGPPVAYEDQSLLQHILTVPFRGAEQVAKNLVYTPAGGWYLANALIDDPVGTVKKLPGAIYEQVKEDVTHPLENPGNLAFDVWGVAGLARGGIARTAQAIKEGPRGFLHPSNPGVIEIQPGAIVGEFRAPIARDVAKVVRKVTDSAGKSTRTPARVGRLRDQHARFLTGVRNAAPRGLERRARKVGHPESEAIYAVATQTRLQDTLALYRAQLGNNKGRFDRNINKKIRANEEATRRGYVVGEAPNIRIADDFPELQEITNLTRQSSDRAGGTRLALGIDTPESQAAAIQKKVALNRTGYTDTPVDTTGAFYLTDRIDDSLIPGPSMRRGDTTIGIPKPVAGQNKGFTGQATLTGRRPANIAKSTAKREQAYTGRELRLQRWEQAKAESVSATDVIQMLQNKEITTAGLRRNWAAVRISPRAATPETREIIRRFLVEDAEADGFLFRRLRDTKSAGRATRQEVLEDLADLASHTDAAGLIRFVDARKVGANIYRGNSVPLIFKVVDTTTMIAQGLTLFTRGPGYLAPNLASQQFMTLIHGLDTLANEFTLKPLRVLRKLDPEERGILLETFGSGAMRSVIEGRTSFSATLDAAYRGTGNFYGRIMDDFWRYNTGLTEAARRGYGGVQGAKRLAAAAKTIGPATPLNAMTKAQRDVMAIREATRFALGRFDNLGHVEREFARRVIWFYPVIKGLAEYTVRLPVDHPAKAALINQLGEDGAEKTEAVLGALIMRLLPGVFPTDPNADKTLEHIAVSDPQSFSITSIGADIADFLDDPARAFRDRLTPGVAIGLLGLGINPRGGYTDDRPFLERVKEWAGGFVPVLVAKKRIDQNASGEDQDRLFAFSPEQAKRQLVVGSVGSKQLNVPYAQSLAERNYVPKAERDKAEVDAEKAKVEKYLTEPSSRTLVYDALDTKAQADAATEGITDRVKVMQAIATIAAKKFPQARESIASLVRQATTPARVESIITKLRGSLYNDVLSKWHAYLNTKEPA